MSDFYFILFNLFIYISNIIDAWYLRNQIIWCIKDDVLLPPAQWKKYIN